MTFELGRALLLSDAISADGLASALLVAAQRGMCLPRALIVARVIEPARLDAELSRVDAPVLRHIVPLTALVMQLPPGLCERLLAVPVREDDRTGTVDLAVVDVRDSHTIEELSYWLKKPLRVVRTSLSAMDSALKRLKPTSERTLVPLAAPIWVPMAKGVRSVTETPLYGTPAAKASMEDAFEDATRDKHAAESARDEEIESESLSTNIPIPLRRKGAIEIIELGARPSLDMDPERGGSLPVEVPKLPAHDGPATIIGRTWGIDALPPIEGSPRTVLGIPAPRIDDVPLSRDSRDSPSTARGPYAQSSIPPPMVAAPFPDIGSTVTAIRGAATRDEILNHVLAGVRTVARKVALFAIKRDVFVGWSCTPELAEPASLRLLQIPAAAPTVLALAVSGGSHLGRVARTEAHAALLAVLREAPGEVAVTTIAVDGKPALVIFADELGDTLIATRRMDELSRVAGDALLRVVRARAKRA